MTTSQRRNRERKLASAIAAFLRMPRRPSYHNYLRLQVRGTGDMFAMMDDASIHQVGFPQTRRIRGTGFMSNEF